MSELSVISRTQQIIVDPASQGVSVVSGGAKGSGPTTGLPNISGMTVRGTIDTSIVVGVFGTNVNLDSTNGVLERQGTDVEIIAQGTTSTQLRVTQDGLYNIGGYVRLDGTPPQAGSLAGLRVNGNCIRRQQFVPAAYSAVSLQAVANLKRNDIVQLFCYNVGGTMNASAVAQNQIDAYGPMLQVWRVSSVSLYS